MPDINLSKTDVLH